MADRLEATQAFTYQHADSVFNASEPFKADNRQALAGIFEARQHIHKAPVKVAMDGVEVPVNRMSPEQVIEGMAVARASAKSWP